MTWKQDNDYGSSWDDDAWFSGSGEDDFWFSGSGDFDDMWFSGSADYDDMFDINNFDDMFDEDFDINDMFNGEDFDMDNLDIEFPHIDDVRGEFNHHKIIMYEMMKRKKGMSKAIWNNLDKVFGCGNKQKNKKGTGNSKGRDKYFFTNKTLSSFTHNILS